MLPIVCIDILMMIAAGDLFVFSSGLIFWLEFIARRPIIFQFFENSSLIYNIFFSDSVKNSIFQRKGAFYIYNFESRIIVRIEKASSLISSSHSR